MLHPGEKLNFIVQIQRRSWIKEKDVISKIAHDYKLTRFTNETQLEDLSPAKERLGRVKETSAQPYYDSAYSSHDRCLLRSSNKFMRRTFRVTEAFVGLRRDLYKLPHLVDLSGFYQTPLSIRTRCACSSYVMECLTSVSWEVRREKNVSISLAVLNVNRDKKIADLGLTVTNKCHAQLNLLVTINRPEDKSLIFESEFLRLGVFEPGQTKYVCLKAKILREGFDQDLTLNVKKNTRDGQMEGMDYTIRLHLA